MGEFKLHAASVALPYSAHARTLKLWAGGNINDGHLALQVNPQAFICFCARGALRPNHAQGRDLWPYATYAKYMLMSAACKELHQWLHRTHSLSWDAPPTHTVWLFLRGWAPSLPGLLLCNLTQSLSEARSSLRALVGAEWRLVFASVIGNSTQKAFAEVNCAIGQNQKLIWYLLCRKKLLSSALSRWLYFFYINVIGHFLIKGEKNFKMP